MESALTRQGKILVNSAHAMSGLQAVCANQQLRKKKSDVNYKYKKSRLLTGILAFILLLPYGWHVASRCIFVPLLHVGIASNA